MSIRDAVHSLKFKVVFSYFMLNVISISVFSWVISINQLELISDNSRFQAKELISSVVSSLHKMPLANSEGTISAQDHQIAVESVVAMLSRVMPNYVLFDEHYTLKTSDANQFLPASYREQANRANALEKNSGVEYHLNLSEDRKTIEVYIPLGPIGLPGITAFSRISLESIGSRYSDLYKEIGLTVLGMTLLHVLFGWLLFRLIVSPILQLQVGAQRVAHGDYAVKIPVARDDEIGILASSFNYMTENLRDAFLRVNLQMDQLKQAHGRIEQMAITDELTGLYNRRHFFDFIQRHISQSIRHGSPLGLIILDIDHFKKVNDTYGHIIGDRILRETGHLLAQMVRKSDVVARYGGEEIILLFPETSLENTIMAAEKIRATICGQRFELPDGVTITISASFGVVELQNYLVNVSKDTKELHTAFIDSADHALYRAKHEGRNRVAVFLTGVD